MVLETSWNSVSIGVKSWFGELMRWIGSGGIICNFVWDSIPNVRYCPFFPEMWVPYL